MSQLVQNINKGLAAIGGAAEGNFKIYSANSRLRLFLKAEKLPGAPAIELSVDLPGDMDSLVATGANTLMDAAGVGNAPEEPAPSN